MKNIAAIIVILFATNVMAQTESLKLSSDVWPPFTDVQSEKSLALDIVEEALESLSIAADFEIIDFGSVMEGIKSGEADGSAALWKDDTREEFLYFSDAYLQNQLVLVGRKGSNVAVSSFAELEMKRIGVVENYSYGEELLAGKNNNIVEGTSDQQNLERLISEEIDYFLVDALLIQYLLKYQLNDVREFLEIGENPMIVKSLHLAIRKDIPNADQLLVKFNEAIKTMMADGSYNEILELSWVRADVDGDGELELILAGDEAGTSAPDNSYNILYSEQKQGSGGYYVNGTKYKTWNDVPEQYKVDIPKVNAQPNMNESSMKIHF